MAMMRFMVAVALAGAAAGCSQQELRTFNGYAAGEYVQVVVPAAGNLAHLGVQAGTAVREGETLFSLDDRKEAAARENAEDRLRRAHARLEQARRSGQASSIEDAQGALDVLQSELAQTEWRLKQKTVRAPREGVVVDTLFREGEWIPAGSAVVSMLAPENLTIRFHVPQHVAGSLRHGQPVKLRCDGCDESLSAEIVYVSPIAEAVEVRAGEAFRFVAEARPMRNAVARLRPGSAVEVLL
jgi:HlyD family secretion protein